MIISKYEILYFMFMMLSIVYIILGSRLIYAKDYSDLTRRFLHYDSIKTGDLLLVSYSNLDAIVSNSMMGLKFTHAAICSKEGADLYVYESSNYFEEVMGFIKIPFSQWLGYNKHTLILYNRLGINKDSGIKRAYLSKMFDKFRKVNMTNETFNMVDFAARYFLLPQENYSNLDFKAKNYACYEVVLSMMKEVGIILDMKSTENYTTDDMVGMKRFKLRKSFDYDEYFIADINSLLFMSD